MTEVWRPIKGQEGRYEVSNLGRVRGIRTEFLAPVLTRHGYLRVGLSKRLRTIHSLVAEAFLGERPKGYQINHLNSNRHDNRVGNLEYTTPKGNQRHSWQTTARQPPHQGERTHFAKLTDANVIEIRKMRAWDGLTYAEIARHFNTKPANVWHICAGKTWKHLL
jgi:hypothetical protein